MTTLTTGSPSTTTTTSGIQPFAMPYAQQNLANAWALTQQPYQPYQGQQNAAMTGLQNQSFAGAQNLSVNPNSIQAGNVAGQAAQGLLNTNYNPIQAGYQSVNAPQLNNYQMQGPGNVYSQGFNNYQAANLMNPYLQQSLAPQLQLLQQQQGIQANQMAGQATQAGAFGGSRFGIQNALQNQANQLTTSNLVGNAYNTAFNNAQNQFNTQNAASLQAQQANQQARLATNQGNLSAALQTQALGAGQNLTAQQANQQAGLTAQQANINQQQYGAGLGLQGLQSAAQAAATQNNIGQTQNAQNASNIGLQNQLGVQQQAYQQGLLNTQYNNFQNQLNYPYQQTSYMQNLVNGYPATQSTAITQPGTPSYLQQGAALGMGAYGLSQLLNLFAEGGLTKSYRSGGEVKRMATGKTARSSGSTALVEKAIQDEELAGHNDIAQGLSEVFGISGTSIPTPNINTTIPGSGAPQAGSSTGINAAASHYQAPAAYSATGSPAQQRSIAPAAMPSSDSGSLGLPSMQELIAMKKEAARNPTMEQIAQDPNGLANYFSSGKTPDQLAAQQEQPVASEAAGGLQSVYLSDDMVPSHHANGGITDVARFDDGGRTETPEQIKARLAATPLSDLPLIDPSRAPVAEGPDLTAVQPAPQPNTEAQKQQILQGLYQNKQMPYQEAVAQAIPQGQPQAVPQGQPQAVPQGQPAAQVNPASIAAATPQNTVPSTLPANATDAQIRTAAGRAAYEAAMKINTNQQEPLTQDRWDEMRAKETDKLIKSIGNSPIQTLIDANNKAKEDNKKDLHIQKGLAALSSIPDILEGNRADRGLARGVSAFAKNYGSAMQSSRAADAQLDKMNQSLAVAKRAEELKAPEIVNASLKTFIEARDKENQYRETAIQKKADVLAKISADEKGFRPVIDTSGRVTAASLKASQIQDEFEVLRADLANKGKTDAELKAIANARVNSQYSAGLQGNINTTTTALTKEQEAEREKRKEKALGIFNSPLFPHGKDTKATYKKYVDKYGDNAGAMYAKDQADALEDKSSAAPAPRAGTPREVPSSDILPYDVSSKQNPTEAQYAKLKPGEKFYWNGQLLSKGQ